MQPIVSSPDVTEDREGGGGGGGLFCHVLAAIMSHKSTKKLLYLSLGKTTPTSTFSFIDVFYLSLFFLTQSGCALFRHVRVVYLAAAHKASPLSRWKGDKM